MAIWWEHMFLSSGRQANRLIVVECFVSYVSEKYVYLFMKKYCIWMHVKITRKALKIMCDIYWQWKYKYTTHIKNLPNWVAHLLLWLFTKINKLNRNALPRKSLNSPWALKRTLSSFLCDAVGDVASSLFDADVRVSKAGILVLVVCHWKYTINGALYGYNRIQ